MSWSRSAPPERESCSWSRITAMKAISRGDKHAARCEKVGNDGCGGVLF